MSSSSSKISAREHRKKSRQDISKPDGCNSSENDGEASSYENDFRAIKDEQMKRKEYLKALETPEEKRARRLAKKAAKERKRQMISGVDGLGYSNSSNPFGDTQLTENFVWQKKMEKEGVKNLSSYEQRKRQRKKLEEMCVELDKVKKRREDREREKMARDDEMTLIQRQKEAAMFSQWEKQEDDFHLLQARLRSTIRIRDGRAKPIDLLAAYINPAEENLEIQMHEPYAALVGLSIDDLEDLLEDIKVYVSIDQKGNVEFWEDITIMVEDELEKLKKKVEQDNAAKRRDVINVAVHTDVQGIFRGKTHSQLIALQNQIKTKITSGGSIDVGYWEALLQQLKAFMAKARLKERHQHFLKSKLTELKMESTVPGSLTQPHGADTKLLHQEDAALSPSANLDSAQVPDKETEDENQADREERDREDEEEMSEKMELQRMAEADARGRAVDAYNVGSFSPKLIPPGDIEEEKWTDYTEDMRKLEYLREQVKRGSTVEEEEEADNLFNKEMLRGMNENEEAFNVPVPISSKKYLWSDKYRPRKPRFFNRVHTGYEWNKYNQTHYDTDNPPPKIVQGYKFNIFYPDLFDKTVTPRYTLTPCYDDPDFAILRFATGPPYEDIAFKVVDREWEYSHRHGFRCQFYNNIFQLYFHFKRYRYRR